MTFLVHVPEPDLGFGIPLLRRQTVPPHCLAVVLWHAPTFLVHVPEPDLGFGIPLLRRQTVPPGRRAVVPRHTPTLGVHDPQPELSFGTPLLNKNAECPDCGGGIPTLKRFHRIVKCLRCRGQGAEQDERQER